MTLRARLTLFFVGIVVVPLLISAIILRGLLASEVERRTSTRLQAAAHTVAAVWEDRLELARREVRQAAARIAAVGIQEHLDGIRRLSALDFLVVSRDGHVVAASVTPARFLPGVEAPGAATVASSAEDPPVVRAQVRAVGDGTTVVTGGWYTDGDFAGDMAGITGLAVELVHGGRPVASTLNPPPPVPEPSAEPFDVGDENKGFLVPVGRSGGVLLVAPDTDVVPTMPLWIVAGAGLALAVALGWALANLIARPLDRLAAGAREVAAGNLEARIEGSGRVDVGRLAEAFNAMTASLREHVGELKESRDELRGTLDRLGATLQSTHDLGAMLEVVLDTAAVTLRASAGALFLGGHGGQKLRLEVARGYEAPEGAMLDVGSGVAGRAAAGKPILANRPGLVPQPVVEPPFDTAVAVPLVRWDRTLGVLALYGRSVPEPFQARDLDTLAAFAAQASVAIENVMLHEEAERLSITDGLTGVFNRRYLALSLRREIERAQRFGRSLSLLMIDIDRFKDINDEHGHQRGDEVLVDLARRVLGEIRSQIDHFARYGGEEFVILLPETPCEGALRVAERVRRRIGERPFASSTGPPLRVTVSIGAAAYPDDGDSADDLLRAADGALYRAKERGRDRVEPAARLEERG